MSLLQKISPEWPLRIGTALTYLVSGIDIFQHPRSWVWAIPGWFKDMVGAVMPIETYLKIQAVGEIAMAVAFLLWFIKPKYLKWVALLSAFEMLGILILSPPSSFVTTTFRDLGLLGGSLTLFLLLYQREKNED